MIAYGASLAIGDEVNFDLLFAHTGETMNIPSRHSILYGVARKDSNMIGCSVGGGAVQHF